MCEGVRERESVRVFGWAFWVHVCGAWMCGVGVLWCFEGVYGSVCCLGVSVCVCVGV